MENRDEYEARDVIWNFLCPFSWLIMQIVANELLAALFS